MYRPPTVAEVSLNQHSIAPYLNYLYKFGFSNAHFQGLKDKQIIDFFTLIFVEVKPNYTALNLLESAGIEKKSMVALYRQKNGASCLKTLINLLYSEPKIASIPLIQFLAQHQISSEDILLLLSQDRGLEKINALIDLFTPIIQQNMPQDIKNVMSYYQLFLSVGITKPQWTAILQRWQGEQGLEALKSLFLSIGNQADQAQFDNQGRHLNYAKILIENGFDLTQLCHILNHDNGFANLHALITSLITPMPFKFDGKTKYLRDSSGRCVSYLRCMLNKGFTPAMLISVLNHPEGAKNLEALQRLFPETNRIAVALTVGLNNTLTFIHLFQYYGITVEHMFTLLNHKNGWQNIQSLCKLFEELPKHLIEQFNQIFQGVYSSLWGVLCHAGLKIENIIACLNSVDGEKNIHLLIDIIVLAKLCDDLCINQLRELTVAILVEKESNFLLKALKAKLIDFFRKELANKTSEKSIIFDQLFSQKNLGYKNNTYYFYYSPQASCLPMQATVTCNTHGITTGL